MMPHLQPRDLDTMETEIATVNRSEIDASLAATRPLQPESCAASIERWANAAADTYSINGPTIEWQTPAAERMARLQRLANTPADGRAVFEHMGAFAI
jgi:hypothetical protein